MSYVINISLFSLSKFLLINFRHITVKLDEFMAVHRCKGKRFWGLGGQVFDSFIERSITCPPDPRNSRRLFAKKIRKRLRGIT